MKKLLQVLISVALLAQPAWSQPRELALDSLLRAEVSQRQFSGVVVLAENGVPVYRHAVGTANDSTPMTLNTRFRLASITKAFTSVLVMQLVERGQLTTESKVAELLPEQKLDRGTSISVHDLLLHRSGLPGESDVVYETSRDARSIILETVATRDYRKYGDFNYSNLGYLVLGLIIERITGKD